MTLIVVCLVGIGIIGSTIVTKTWAHNRSGGHHRSHAVTSVEQAEQRALDVAAWLAGSVDADEAQQDRIEQILADSARQLYPLSERRHEIRRALITEASRADLDEAAIEAIRAEMVQAVEEATATLSTTFIKVAQVLSSEQRQTFLAVAAEFGHRKWH